MRTLLMMSMLACVGCATETVTVPCMTPAGTYKVDLAAADGNCPETMQKAIIESLSDTVSKPSEACYTKSGSTSDSYEITELGVTCSRSFSSSTYGTYAEYGGTMSVGIVCSDNSTCQQAFSVHYTKQ